MFLILVFAMVAIVLAVAFYVGTYFFQGMLYTEPTPGLNWQAPVAGVVMAAFFTGWCFLITRSDATEGGIPYDAIHRFVAKVEMIKDPNLTAEKIWAIRSDGKSTFYTVRINDNLKPEYIDAQKKPWRPGGVVAIELEHNGQKVRFDVGPANDGGYRPFTSSTGWTMNEYDNGPDGRPTQFQWGRFLANLSLNLIHGVLWFVCLWLILRYQWDHSLGFALILWLVMTVGMLPMLLDESAKARPVGEEQAAQIPRLLQFAVYTPRGKV